MPLYPFLLVLLIILLRLPSIRSCARTSSTSSPAATTAATTTASSNLCATCTAGQIMQLMVNDGAIPITSLTVSMNSAGCNVLTILCNGNGPGSTVFISYNQDNAGTTQGTVGADTVTDTLTCDGNGNWQLIKNGAMDVITQVECDST